jgi:hypothetical protein
MEFSNFILEWQTIRLMALASLGVAYTRRRDYRFAEKFP